VHVVEGVPERVAVLAASGAGERYLSTRHVQEIATGFWGDLKKP
jgi:hypothetical protein